MDDLQFAATFLGTLELGYQTSTATHAPDIGKWVAGPLGRLGLFGLTSTSINHKASSKAKLWPVSRLPCYHIQIQLDTPPTSNSCFLPFPAFVWKPWDTRTAATMYKSSTSFSREFRPDGLVVKQMPPKGHNKTWHLPAGNKSIRKNPWEKASWDFFSSVLVKFTKKTKSCKTWVGNGFQMTWMHFKEQQTQHKLFYAPSPKHLENTPKHDLQTKSLITPHPGCQWQMIV